MVGDDVRISQVVMNLLTNAVKYTEKGSASLIIRDIAREDGYVDLYFGIRDTGIGIREEDMGKLFESFERLEEKRNRSIEGTGLGMPIVVKLLALMGSELKVESVYGEGSLFSFTLRQQIADDTPLGDYNAAYAKSGRHEAAKTGLYAPAAKVLVVDDNSMNLKVAKNLLKLYGISPDLVASGEEAIERIAEKSYNIVFLDHMMPVMDGIETLGKLKEMGLPGDGTAVVALTANAVAGAREAYLSAGFDDYLSKPMELNRLEDKLRKYIPAELLEKRADAESVKQAEPACTAESAPAGTDTSVESAADGNEGLTRNELLERCGVSVENGLMYCAGDDGFYTEMLTDYAGACDVKCGELESFYAAKDLEEYRVRVHGLKSVSRTIGADTIADSAKALEDAARTGDTEYIEQHHDEFIAAYRKTADDIAEALGRS
ncbi:MAG: response regulator, partial [Ruminiclostridium sp.]|nr:response regulator [Ruminiclostridium sp.]